MPNTPKDVLALAKDAGVKIVDLRFCDLPGIMQHFSMPVSELTEDGFADGYGFDGSSIRGFQAIHESDMLLIPDPTTAVIDPFREAATLNINCFIQDPITRESYSRDPRYIAKKAEQRLIASGIADASFWGPELEFFIFDEVRFDQNSHEGYYSVDSEEGIWNSGMPGSRGYRPRYKEGYFPVPPTDQNQDIRSEMILTMIDMGIDIEIQHHEVGTAGQAEIDMRFSPLLAMADKVMNYKYVVKSTAWKHGKTATFMPKPVFADNGSGMHVHSSLWKNGEPLFFDAAGYGGLSEMARHYVGGLLKHAPALLAFCAPTTNSYRRLVPGYEAPINLVYSQRNRSAACRIPMY
ncbi:MAG TPA: type I glutamate--ammonia ligase, partial [Actinomycetota bacterium]|nr:type I glutamate--ammonia ligase [Actinomycetota bacterium]